MGIGMQVAGSVAENLLAKRIKRETEEAAKATKGKSQAADQPQPGAYGARPTAVMPEQLGGPEFFDTPEQLSGPETSMGWDMNPMMGMSLYGSGQFTKKELKQGYRKMKG